MLLITSNYYQVQYWYRYSTGKNGKKTHAEKISTENVDMKKKLVLVLRAQLMRRDPTQLQLETGRINLLNIVFMFLLPSVKFWNILPVLFF